MLPAPSFEEIRDKFTELNENYGLTYKQVAYALARDYLAIRRILISCREPKRISYLDVHRTIGCLNKLEQQLKATWDGDATKEERAEYFKKLLVNVRLYMETYELDDAFNTIDPDAK